MFQCNSVKYFVFPDYDPIVIPLHLSSCSNLKIQLTLEEKMYCQVNIFKVLLYKYFRFCAQILNVPMLPGGGVVLPYNVIWSLWVVP